MSFIFPIEWRRILLEALVTAALGAVLGLSFHYRLVLEVLAGDHAPRTAEVYTTGYPSPASLAETQKLLAAGALAVDARVDELFRDGHLPGAISLPLQEVDDRLRALQARVPFTRTLLVYCSGSGCTDSFDLAVRLKQAGYRDVRVFEEGFPGWRDAGLRIETGAP